MTAAPLRNHDAHANDRAPIELPQRERMEILVAVLAGIFLAALDQTVVGTALPRIVTDLRGNDVYIWPFTSYLVTATISGPLYGKLSDIFGRRVGIFLVGSLLSGISQTMGQFIAFRGLQGLGAGALFPISIAIIGDIFSPSERGKYLGFFGAVFGLSSIIGPAIGGLITDNIGWHWIFFVNLPIGVVVLYVIYRILPTHRDESATRSIDYLGAAFFVAALVPILIGLTNKQFGQWTDGDVGGFIAVGLVLAAVFVWVESRAKEPIVPLHLFRIPAFTASVAAMFLAIMGFFAAVVFLPRWYQVVQGSSATISGYQILPLLLGLIVSAITTGQIVARTGRFKAIMVSSLVVSAVGLFLLTNLRPDTPAPLIWLWMAIAGVGVGPAFAIFTLVVQNNVPPRELGTGTSSLTLFQQVGGTVGLAITGSIFGSVLLEEMPKQIQAAGVPADFAARFAQGGGSALNNFGGVGNLGASILASIPEQARAQVQPLIPAIVRGIHEAFSIATASTFVLGIGTALLAALVVLVLMPATRMHVASSQPAMAPTLPPGELEPSAD
ncbi:MAG: MFS transporter [Chloroflexi bacterium]|nr:MAG: MFS transporter [Chloroflexota bacterium]